MFIPKQISILGGAHCWNSNWNVWSPYSISSKCNSERALLPLLMRFILSPTQVIHTKYNQAISC